MSLETWSDEELAHVVLRDIRNSDGAHELARRVLQKAKEFYRAKMLDEASEKGWP